jgi:DNA-binding response OmpR family regulator
MKPDVTIIAMSGSDTSEDKTKAKECGGQDFLIKPFTANDLFSVLHIRDRLRQNHFCQ